MKETALTLFEHSGLVAGNAKAEAIFTTEVTTFVLPKGSKEVSKTTDMEEVAKLVALGGVIVGRKSVVKQTKQADARTVLSLKGKDNQPQWEMTRREAERFGANIIRNRLATMDWDKVGLKRFAETIGKDGLTVLDIKLKELPIKEASITLEQAVEAWKGIMTREQVIEMFAKAGIRPKGVNVEVKSEVVPPAQLSEGVKEVAKEAAATEKQVERNSKR
jgi:hypothetical protein